MLVRLFAVSVLVVGLVGFVGCGASKPKNRDDDEFAEKDDDSRTISKAAAEVRRGDKDIGTMSREDAMKLIALPGAGGKKDRKKRDE